MPWDHLGITVDAVVKLLTAMGGLSGLVLILNYFLGKRASRNSETLDMRKVVDSSTAAMLDRLERHNVECTKRLADLEAWQDEVNRWLVPAIWRDHIMTEYIRGRGFELPEMPEVRWPSVSGTPRQQ